MNIPLKTISPKKNWVRRASGLAAGLGLLVAAGQAYADEPLAMAPPIQSGYAQSGYAQSGYAQSGYEQTTPTADSVFHWSEVPQNQQVPIQRAVFDQGGYQLYDTAGETIVVPFTDQNLYVMKFGESTNGSMYFVNEGSTPVLYVPRNGYLENAAVPGARWFPFTEKFHPSHPVFLGVAPSWSVFVGMGWYPGMYCHGGYWHDTPFVAGSIFFPSFGLFFEIGGRHYDGWDRYHDYYDRHPAPYRVTIVNNSVYEHASRPDWGGRRFEGGGSRDYAPHTFGYGRTYPSGGDRPIGGDRSIGGRTFGGGQGYGTTHTDNSGRYNSDRSGSSGRVFQGAGGEGQGRSSGAVRIFSNGTRSNSGGGDHTFSGGNRTYNSGGDRSNSTGDRTFGNDRPFGSGRPFGGAFVRRGAARGSGPHLQRRRQRQRPLSLRRRAHLWRRPHVQRRHGPHVQWQRCPGVQRQEQPSLQWP